MLELPIILAFFVVSGLRATFNIPSELPANWLFQLTEGRDSREYVAAIRTWVILCGILPLMALMAPIEFSYWPWEEALFHLVFLAMISVILLHVLFFNFRKVPFTCSYYPGKTNLTLLAVVYLYGFTTYSSSMAALERWLLGGTSRSFLFLAAAVSGIAALSAARRRRDGARLIYEDQPDPLVRGLGLN
jgi:hypothetical protein